MRAQGTLPRFPGAGARILTKATTLLCSVLLVAPSSAYAATLLTLPNSLSTRGAIAPEATLGWTGRSSGRHGQFAAHGSSGGGGGADCPLMQTGSKGRLFKAVTTLRGGSPAVSVPGFGKVAEALGSISMPTAAALTGGPALFVQGLLLSMLMSVDGFRVREHFVSYGYGFSVALQAAGAAWIFRDGLHTLSALHVAGLVAYGLRLVLFCRWRDSLSSFQNRRKRLVKPAKQPTKAKGRPYPFWGIVSMLYALLALPSVYVMRRLPPAEGWVGVSQAGLAIMAVGLLIEGVADLQKSHFKEKTPQEFCSSGLYRLSRHPNYFGEAVFWGGVWLAATPSFSKWYHWVFATLGPIQIVSVILRATSGLEMRQAEKYGGSKEWKEYAASTPVFVPGTRQYTWGKGEKKKDK